MIFGTAYTICTTEHNAYLQTPHALAMACRHLQLHSHTWPMLPSFWICLCCLQKKHVQIFDTVFTPTQALAAALCNGAHAPYLLDLCVLLAEKFMQLFLQHYYAGISSCTCNGAHAPYLLDLCVLLAKKFMQLFLQHHHVGISSCTVQCGPRSQAAGTA